MKIIDIKTSSYILYDVEYMEEYYDIKTRTTIYIAKQQYMNNLYLLEKVFSFIGTKYKILAVMNIYDLIRSVNLIYDNRLHEIPVILKKYFSMSDEFINSNILSWDELGVRYGSSYGDNILGDNASESMMSNRKKEIELRKNDNSFNLKDIESPWKEC
jgi:hypothetical protein